MTNQIKFELQSSTAPAVARKAILLYETVTHGYRPETSYATMHDIENVGTKARPNFQIMPGAPISSDSLLRSLGSLSEKYVLNAEWLPENVLSFSPMHLVWWSPAADRRVFFRNKELGNRSAIVPHPPLLHLVVRGSWYIFAMRDNKRPTQETELFHAPYFNVWDDGKICVGSANIPEQLTTALIPQWEAAFFDSAFTHTNGQIKKSLHPRGEYALWKELLDGAYSSYPLELLSPKQATVAAAFKAMRKMMGGANG